MKTSTLNTLLVAKGIFEKTKPLVDSGNKYSCTAGIILLQDFVELIVLAALDELDVSEQRNLESKSFDELLGELKKLNVPVKKSGTIKALNKQRVIAKHYGQLSEPASVANYFNTALEFSDALLKHVVGSSLQEIFLTDTLKDGPTKDLIKEAISCSNKGEFLEALVKLRKSFYLAYEREYCIYAFRFRDVSDAAPFGLLALAMGGGMKAYHWTRNKTWIDANVRTPADYIQMDPDKFKTDCIEWGTSTADASNFRRLTPIVMETDPGVWHVDYDTNFAANELNIENFNYCLDILLGFLLKKQEFDGRHKWPKRVRAVPTPPIYTGKPIYEKSSENSKIVGFVSEHYYYSVDRVVSGFTSDQQYLYVHLYPQGGEMSLTGHIWGYLLKE